MYITLETDYAIRIVLYLCSSDKRVDATMISEHTGVTLRFSLKILRKLVAQGIAFSYKGTHGGYEIARDCRDITLLEVIETISGDINFSRCLTDDYDCNNPMNTANPFCKVQQEFQKLTHDIRERLGNITFYNLLAS